MRPFYKVRPHPQVWPGRLDSPPLRDKEGASCEETDVLLGLSQLYRPTLHDMCDGEDLCFICYEDWVTQRHIAWAVLVQHRLWREMPYVVFVHWMEFCELLAVF